MKKLLAASVLAFGLLAGVQQPASAWHHFKFGVGLNFECSSGNNCCLWGMFRNGQAPEGCGPGGMGYDGGYAAANYPAAAYAGYASPNYPGNYAANYAANNYYSPSHYYQPSNYYPPSNPYQLANYPSNYPANYYLMGYPGSASGINFYGN